MSLNIKNEQTHELVQELAEITGESQTAAVTSAVRERLARLRRCERGGLAERVLAMGQDISTRLSEPYVTGDHGDLLYDEKGLPA